VIEEPLDEASPVDDEHGHHDPARQAHLRVLLQEPDRRHGWQEKGNLIPWVVLLRVGIGVRVVVGALRNVEERLLPDLESILTKAPATAPSSTPTSNVLSHLPGNNKNNNVDEVDDQKEKMKDNPACLSPRPLEVPEL